MLLFSELTGWGRISIEFVVTRDHVMIVSGPLALTGLPLSPNVVYSCRQSQLESTSQNKNNKNRRNSISNWPGNQAIPCVWHWCVILSGLFRSARNTDGVPHGWDKRVFCSGSLWPAPEPRFKKQDFEFGFFKQTCPSPHSVSWRLRIFTLFFRSSSLYLVFSKYQYFFGELESGERTLDTQYRDHIRCCHEHFSYLHQSTMSL